MDIATVKFTISIQIGSHKTHKCSIGNLLIIMTHSLIINHKITMIIPIIRAKCLWSQGLPSINAHMEANQLKNLEMITSRGKLIPMLIILNNQLVSLQRPHRAFMWQATKDKIWIRGQKASDTTNNFDDLSISITIIYKVEIYESLRYQGAQGVFLVNN